MRFLSLLSELFEKAGSFCYSGEVRDQLPTDFFSAKSPRLSFLSRLTSNGSKSYWWPSILTTLAVDVATRRTFIEKSSSARLGATFGTSSGPKKWGFGQVLLAILIKEPLQALNSVVFRARIPEKDPLLWLLLKKRTRSVISPKSASSRAFETQKALEFLLNHLCGRWNNALE